MSISAKTKSATLRRHRKAALQSCAMPVTKDDEADSADETQEAKGTKPNSKPKAAAPVLTGHRNAHRNGDRGDGDGDGEPEILVPDPVVWREFGISAMTLYRWSHELDLGFPPAIKINGRNFRSRRELEAFKKRKLREALANRNREVA